MAGCALLAGSPCAMAAGDAATELQSLITTIKAKLQSGKTKESDFTAELKQFDDLLAEHRGEKTDDVAKIAYMKAMLYEQVFQDQDKADAIVKQVETDFEGTSVVKQIKAQEAHEAASKAAQAALAEGKQFPDFQTKDSNGKPLSLSDFHGKVVMVDFWATWCPPCREEVPNVVATYKKFHDKGFEIVGVSLDQDKQKMVDFTKQNGMSWVQYFDGKGWQNELAQKYGIESIPTMFVLDGNGKIVARDVRGEQLGQAVEKALATH